MGSKAQRTAIDGKVLHSIAERKRYELLLELLKANVIQGLECQVPYPITVNGLKITAYFADFRYTVDGEVVIEDVKGFKTKDYILKKKLVEAQYGITITEIDVKRVLEPHGRDKTALGVQKKAVAKQRLEKDLPD